MDSVTGTHRVTSAYVDLVDRFERDGFALPLPVLERDAAEAARREVLALLERRENDPRINDFLNYKTHLVYRWVSEIIHNRAMLEAVSAVLGPDLLLWSCAFPIKPPRSSGRYTWHQDATYWSLTPANGLTVWLALGDVGPVNGAMSFLAGWHRRGQLDHVNTFAQDVMLPRGQEIVGLKPDSESVACTLASGEASLHHLHAPHASGPNASGDWRIGCAMVFVPTDVRPSVRESAMLVCGHDRFRHFDPEPRPSADMSAAAIAAHGEAMARMGTYRNEQALGQETANQGELT